MILIINNYFTLDSLLNNVLFDFVHPQKIKMFTGTTNNVTLDPIYSKKYKNLNRHYKQTNDKLSGI